MCCNAGPLGPHSKTAPRSKWLAVAMFCLVAALLNADQNLMAPVLSDIAADFGFDARQVPRVLQVYCLCCVSSSVCFCSDSAHSRHCSTCPKTCCAPCPRQRDVYLGGWVSAAFFLVGAPAALLVGYISDRVNRKHLLLWVVLLGEWHSCVMATICAVEVVMHSCKVVPLLATFLVPILLLEGQPSLIGPPHCLSLLQVKAPAFSPSL